MPVITSQTLAIQSCPVHYLICGNEKDRPAFLLHSTKFQAETWRALGTLAHPADSPLADCDLLHASVPEAIKIVIDGVSDPWYLDKPDMWHTELAAFLRGLPQ